MLAQRKLVLLERLIGHIHESFPFLHELQPQLLGVFQTNRKALHVVQNMVLQFGRECADGAIPFPYGPILYSEGD